MTDGALPRGWHWAELADVSEVVKKPRGFKPERPTAFVPMAAISERGTPVVDFESREPSQLTNAYFEDGDLLVARITPCFENGKQGIVRQVPGGYGFATTEVYVFRSTDELSAEYLALLLSFPTYRSELRGQMEGATGRMRVPLDAVLSLRAPIPPLSEQQAIVTLVAEKFGRIDDAEEGLAAARVLSGGLRTAVLATLTADEWPQRHIGEVGIVFVGATPSRRDPNLWNGGIPWVSSGEVAFHRITHTKETISEKGLGNRERRLHPPGTVLMAMIGEGKTRGQAAILDVHATHNQNSAAIRLDPELMFPEFLFLCLMRQYHGNRSFGRGGQQPALNKSLVEALEVPCPPLEQQHRLVEEITDALAVIDRTEGDVESAAQLAERFRVAVLRDAIAGKLHPQGETASTNGSAA